jgi:hypothetical protein
MRRCQTIRQSYSPMHPSHCRLRRSKQHPRIRAATLAECPSQLDSCLAHCRRRAQRSSCHCRTGRGRRPRPILSRPGSGRLQSKWMVTSASASSATPSSPELATRTPRLGRPVDGPYPSGRTAADRLQPGRPPATSRQIRERWWAECSARLPADCDAGLVLSFGSMTPASNPASSGSTRSIAART